ncbi:UvrB/UvrC motif-containing protein [Reichenbachiella ulvae]|uniref:UvrB/UvrC motif-containing protein n=1 Tax=Reichenbachiella ulvae TaxID=2980104 RepID=A0ABT3CY62_9BACT|nr:UvrB/UvrC motif-containing protein [Reichenbachiella ulvae]MCV9388638.1 UvrB/UvrC motif-containing protein [Reichenbachiella ulvae]
MRKIITLLFLITAISTYTFAQKSLMDYSLSELDQAKKEAAMNEDYAGAAKFKKAYELRTELDRAVQNEEYGKAADLKNQILSLEGKGNSSSTSRPTQQSRPSYSSSSSSSGNYPTIDFINTVMIWDKNSNTVRNLEYGTPEMVTKAGGFAFYASATSFYKLNGPKSNVTVKEGDSFIIKVTPGMNPRELFKLVNFDLIGDDYKERYLPAYTSSTAAAPFSATSNTSQNTKNYRNIEYKKLSDEYYEIIIKDVLLAGEYAFYGLNKMYAFSTPQMFTNSGAELPKTSYSLGSIYTEPVIAWYGVDYSLFRYINPSLMGQELSSFRLISSWKAQFDKDLNLGRFEAWLRKTQLNVEDELVKDYYKAILESESWIVSNEQRLDVERIQKHIELYPPEGSGLGLTYIVENINQQTERMSGYFVWFDVETKAIIHTQAIEGRGGDTDSWGKYYEEIFTRYIDYHYKLEWRKYQ